MTLFLARVAGPEDAEIAVSGGADLIEIDTRKTHGEETLPLSLVRSVLGVVAGRRPTSVVIGSLRNPPALAAAVAATADAGVERVSVVMPAGAEAAASARALASLAARITIMGLMAADKNPDLALLKAMGASGFSGAMLSVAGSGDGSLLDHDSIPFLKKFVDECHTLRMTAGFAGALEAPDIPRLLLLSPDYLGFRRALCVSRERTGPLDPAAVDVIRGLIPVDPRSLRHGSSPEAKVDYRLVAGRGAAKEPKEQTETDRVFVRDFIVPVRIGAYEREREKTQNLRFNIDVKVTRPRRVAADMRDVFSYDVILDGIRMLVAQGHIALVETLAERIAALLLTDPRVQEVLVRAEKLDIGPGAVGVEIRRERSAEAADVHPLFAVPARDRDPGPAE